MKGDTLSVASRWSVPLGLVFGSLLVGFVAPSLLSLDAKALVLASGIVGASAVAFFGLARLDFGLMCGTFFALTLLTAIFHRDLVQPGFVHPFYGIAIFRVTLPEILAFATVGTALLRFWTDPRGRSLRVGWAPLLILGIVLLGLVSGLLRHGNLELALRDGRKLLYVPIAHLMVVTVLDGESRRRKFMGVLAVAACLAAMAQILQYARGEGFLYGNFLRVTVDVADFLVLAALVAFPLAAMRMGTWKKRTWPLALGLIALALAGSYTTFSRAAWFSVPVVMAVVLFAPVPGSRTRKWLSLSAIVALGWLVVTFSDQFRPLVFERVASLGRPGGDPSVRYRLREFRGAAETISAHPLAGVGFGTPFDAGASLIDRRWRDRSLVHNVFLWTGIKAGLGGILLFAMFIGLILFQLFRVLARPASPKDATLALGFLALLFAFLAISMVGAMLNQQRTAFGLGLISGMAQLLPRAPSMEDEA